MNWINLEGQSQLNDFIKRTVDEESLTVLLFKHSTRCSISSMVLRRIDNITLPANVVPVFLDLIAYREISNNVATLLNVEHESPQMLVINKGVVINYASHTSINESFIASAIA